MKRPSILPPEPPCHANSSLPRLPLLVRAQVACSSRSLRPALMRRCRTLPSIALVQLPSQAASLVAQGKQGLLRPPSSSVLPRWWVGALALVWGSMTPMSTSGGGQTLAMSSTITGPACVMVWAVGGRLRGAWDAHNDKT